MLDCVEERAEALSGAGNGKSLHISIQIDKTEQILKHSGAAELFPAGRTNASGPTCFEVLSAAHCAITLLSCYTVFVSSKPQLRNVTVTLEEDVAQWARIEAARRDTSVSRLLGELLKERMGKRAGQSPAAESADRLASFGKRHKLSLRGLKIKDLINEGRR